MYSWQNISLIFTLGLAAASTDVRALSWQMMPALAIDSVCCSITSCSTDLTDKFSFGASSYTKSVLNKKTWITKDKEYTEPKRLIVEVP